MFKCPECGEITKYVEQRFESVVVKKYPDTIDGDILRLDSGDSIDYYHCPKCDYEYGFDDPDAVEEHRVSD